MNNRPAGQTVAAQQAAIPRHIAAAVDNRRFQLFILPTERCNFRCVYCYEDFALGRARQRVVNGLAALVTRKCATIEHLDISWFGGEPLLAKSVIEQVSQAALHGAACNPGLTYTASMTTNAYLLDPATFARMVSLGITSYQITLDGDEETHDTTRVMPGGRTFETIWRNLVAIRETRQPANIMLRLHLTRANIASQHRLVARVAETFGGDARFSVFFKAIERLGGPNDAALPTLDHADVPDIIGQLRRRLGGDVNVADITDGDGPPVCYAAKANSLVVRADGSIAKCTVAFHDDRNAVGHLNEDGTLCLQQDKLRRWFAPLASEDADALACPWAAMTA